MRKTDKLDNAKRTHRESVDLSAEVGSPKSVALKFVEVINAGDSEELVKLQTEDFTFIDMAGDVYRLM